MADFGRCYVLHFAELLSDSERKGTKNVNSCLGGRMMGSRMSLLFFVDAPNQSRYVIHPRHAASFSKPEGDEEHLTVDFSPYTVF